MRSKYVGDPTKFVIFPRSVSRTTLTRVFTFRYLESEDELDKAFSFLYPLPQNPLLYYPEILKNELLLPALIQLLSHDNTDISLQVISALYEMTDEDVGEDMMEAEEEEGKEEEMGRRLRMIMGDLIEKLVSPACIVI
jgi:beta-catenin-like protein 1